VKAASKARRCARAFANVFLRVPGAADSVDPTPPETAALPATEAADTRARRALLSAFCMQRF